MAMACFRLVTLAPLPERSFPAFSRRKARSTLLLAALPYLLATEFLPSSREDASAFRRSLLTSGFAVAVAADAECIVHMTSLINEKGIAREGFCGLPTSSREPPACLDIQNPALPFIVGGLFACRQ